MKQKHIEIYQYGNLIHKNDITTEINQYLQNTYQKDQIKLTKNQIKKLIQQSQKESKQYKKTLKELDQHKIELNQEEFKNLMRSYRHTRTLEEDLKNITDTLNNTDWLLIKIRNNSLDTLEQEKENILFSR
jgi:DNA repair ATPase RecN